jgi:hypothetical protein
LVTPSTPGWPKEVISDADHLYMRVHEVFVSDEGVAPGAFKDHQGGMSTDWEKYSTPEETRQRAKEPLRNGVIQLVAGSVRGIPGLSVEHTPSLDNRAHTDVFGQKSPEVRLKLKRIAEWIIRASG